MTKSDYKQIVSNAIWDFQKAKFSGNKDKITFELNNLHNVYIMLASRNIEGNEKIRQLILANE
ncbi:protein of unknown function [Ruminococcaceae bacterium BL-6]|nr:protein of unknown function [Ruminococcaceae bacterium BL-6]